MRRPKRRAARKRRSVREACRGRPREAADCSKWHAAGCAGLFIKAVRPKQPSVRSDGLSERLHCLSMKIVLPGCRDCAARVWRLRCSGVRRNADRNVRRTGRAGRGEPGLAGCHAAVPLESACGAGADVVRRVHALRARCGRLRRLPWVGEYVSDSLLISSRHLGKNGLVLSLVDRRWMYVSCEFQRLCTW